MTNRERFWKTMQFQRVDRLPFWADWLGPWQQWQKEGLIVAAGLVSDDDYRTWCLKHFGFEGMYSAAWGTDRVPVQAMGLCPGFQNGRR